MRGQRIDDVSRDAEVGEGLQFGLLVVPRPLVDPTPALCRGNECLAMSRKVWRSHSSLPAGRFCADMVPPMSEWTDPMTDADRRQAVVDLLGVLAYGELIAFERLADDARLAPSLPDKAALGGMAVAEFGHFRKLRDRLEALGVDPGEAMAPFVVPLDAFHDSTAPADWLESLVKAYVGDGFAADFYREVVGYVDDDETKALVLDVLDDTGHAAFAVEHVRAAITADPGVAGRLALWARRLVGEALVQAQRVAVDRDALARLIVGGTGDLAEVGALLARLTQRHAERMTALGLAA